MSHTQGFKSAIYRAKFFFIAVVILCSHANAQTVTNLNGFYRSGQVFLTWNKISNGTAFYKVYRSASPINSSSNLATSEYLGFTNSASSINHNLTNHDGVTQYLYIDSGGAALNATTGLFVATTLVNGNYYYAVTTLIGATENTAIVSGVNTIANPIAETVATPLPVFQSQRIIGPALIDIYTIFTSSKYAAGQPLWLSAGFLASDFVVNRNNATGNNPLKLFFHGGGGSYFDNIQISDGDEIRINLEDTFPDSTISGNWWGANPAYDVYNQANDTVNPTTGVNNNFVERRINNIVDWAIRHLPIDSNRIYLSGSSAGSAGAYFYTITYPDRIAAVALQVGIFNLRFQNDWKANCSLNTGQRNRLDINLRLGTVATNLMCNLGVHTYDALNGGWVIHQYPTKDFPLIYSVNGKRDSETGWTEKTIYYDSVNANHLGGYYFWDNRTHNGSGQAWGNNNFDLYRYRRNSSYPAFAFCSLNEDFGDGNGTTGADHGTLNGSLDWNDNIIDNSHTWRVKIFIRDLHALPNLTVVYPDSGTADVTPRRLQHFSPSPGEGISWSVKHHGQVIQSGTFIYNGGLMVVPQAKIFRDTSIVTLAISDVQTYYLDNDGDGFGNPAVSVQATSQPSGYVLLNTDCNDANNAIHPGAPDVCNSLDDNCNSATDENAITSTVTPAGAVNTCSGTAITLTANGGVGISYQWKKGSNIIADATNSTYSTKKAGTYKVTETNNFSCNATSAATTITVVALPTATITPLGNLDICGTNSVVLQANSGAGLTYQWRKGSNYITTATNQTYTATNKGTYKVVVTNSDGCSKTSAGVTVTKSCREENIQGSEISETHFSLYPNPASGEFTVHLSLPPASENAGDNFTEEAMVKVINTVGQTIYSKTVSVSNGELMEEIQLNPDAASGLYLVQVIVDGVVYSGQVVYEKE